MHSGEATESMAADNHKIGIVGRIEQGQCRSRLDGMSVEVDSVESVTGREDGAIQDFFGIAAVVRLGIRRHRENRVRNRVSGDDVQSTLYVAGIVRRPTQRLDTAIGTIGSHDDLGIVCTHGTSIGSDHGAV